jgi:hypothetical protein
VAWYCEHGNEPSFSREGGLILGQLSNYQLLKDSAPGVSLTARYLHVRAAWVLYEGRLTSSWTGSSEPLLCEGRR